MSESYVSTHYNDAIPSIYYSGQKRKSGLLDSAHSAQSPQQYNAQHRMHHDQYGQATHTYQPNYNIDYGLGDTTVQYANADTAPDTPHQPNASYNKGHQQRRNDYQHSYQVPPQALYDMHPHRPSNNSLYRPPPANSSDPEQRRQFAAWLRERKHMQASKKREMELQQQPVVSQKKEECKFWINGACKHGAKCRFEHIGTPQVKAELCRYVLNNKCSKGANCYYSHDISTVPCRFWHLYGRCKYMYNCPFIHGEVSEQVKQTLAQLNELAAKRKRGEIITADEQRRLDEQARELEKQEEIKKALVVEAPPDPFTANSVFE